MMFPLKTDFFPQMRLTTKERRWYLITGERSAAALRNFMETLDWKKIMKKTGVTYAQAHCIEGSVPMPPLAASTVDEEPHDTVSACLLISATAFAAGTINEALEALASPTTEDYRRVMHFLHGPRFVDGMCLHTITTADSNEARLNTRELTTVKWAAFDDGKTLNSEGGPAGTDYCFLEHSGIHYGDLNSDADEVFGFCVQESIPREGEVPSLAKVRLARGHLHRTGILILPTDRPDVVQVTSVLQMRMVEGVAVGATNDVNAAVLSSGKKKKAALARLMCRRVAAIGRFELLLERRRLNKLKHLPRAEWVADDVRKACAVCQKQFAFRRRKHHCRHCGEVVCASCAPTREVDADTNATINARICTACVVKSRSTSQVARGYAVNRWRNTNLTGENSLMTANENIKAETALSASSTFSISIDSQICARLMRAGYTDEAVRMFDYEDDLSVLSSSSHCSSLSEFDSFDGVVSIYASNQDEGDRRCRHCSRRSSQRSGNSLQSGSSHHTVCSSQSMSCSPLPSNELLERIQAMKADLSKLTISCRQLSVADLRMDDDGYHPPSVSVDAEVIKPQSAIDTFASEVSDARSRQGMSSGIEGSIDVDFINTSEQFTLLCPQTLGRQWRSRPKSCVRQDPGEKSHHSPRLSSMSIVSTLSNSTRLGEEESFEQRDFQDFNRGELDARACSECPAELLAFRQQVEELHRSLAAATSQLGNIYLRQAPSQIQQQQPFDPVAARHQTMYGQLVVELHEIMGLPHPRREH